jgi:hypothetical protein
MPILPELLEANRGCAATFTKGDLSMPLRRKLAVVIHHTDCGNAGTSPRTIQAAKAARTGSSRAGPAQA